MNELVTSVVCRVGQNQPWAVQVFAGGLWLEAAAYVRLLHLSTMWSSPQTGSWTETRCSWWFWTFLDVCFSLFPRLPHSSPERRSHTLHSGAFLLHHQALVWITVFSSIGLVVFHTVIGDSYFSTASYLSLGPKHNKLLAVTTERRRNKGFINH